jgi:Sulfotransferase domain
VALTVVGAGLGRTGTASLKQALELLLGGRCYHMYEVGERPTDVPVWRTAIRGEPVDWQALLRDYSATVDWPAAAFWRELSAANPDALVLLSTRDSPEQWWASMERTIVARISRPVPAGHPLLARHRAMILELLDARFTSRWASRDAAISAYERHNEDVRRSVAPERLLDWRPGDGWAPICTALGRAVPDQPFPHENTTANFRARLGLSEETASTPGA